jgi:hypothetical protein
MSLPSNSSNCSFAHQKLGVVISVGESVLAVIISDRAKEASGFNSSVSKGSNEGSGDDDGCADAN